MRLGLLGIWIALCASADAGPRPGKVVRIERRTKKLYGNPRYCAYSVGDMQAYCYGKKPEVGEHIAIVDMHRLLGTVRVESTDPLGGCPSAASGLWLAHTALDAGDLTAPNDSQVAGVIDVMIDRQAGGKLVKAERVPGDRPLNVDQVIAIDADNDGAADLEFVAFACDDQGNPPGNLSTATGQCLEVWNANGRTFEHLRTDRIPQNCF